ncbi:hypothetical protein [Actinomadura sp. BRA 177]|uniref:hypothetical protein n=1 Tax=Actinomadura sp. BRA 177 TaxID=2745202 RepID=UPI001595CCB0|nr:hypothetical protein [Actinomadura sp. BRA 177]NVI90109.1 hypothetical protein [Actinomadura sp. BRA 177]
MQDSRLAWEAALPELARRSKNWWTAPLRIFGAAVPNNSANGGIPGGGSTGFAREIGQDASTGRLKKYAVPVDVVAERLAPEERKTLRAEGVLPDWFFDAVEKERRTQHKR